MRLLSINTGITIRYSKRSSNFFLYPCIVSHLPSPTLQHKLHEGRVLNFNIHHKWHVVSCDLSGHVRAMQPRDFKTCFYSLGCLMISSSFQVHWSEIVDQPWRSWRRPKPLEGYKGRCCDDTASRDETSAVGKILPRKTLQKCLISLI